MDIGLGDLTNAQVIALLIEHLTDMIATSPPESVHALDISSLKQSHVTFWTAWEGEKLLGCIALQYDGTQGQKSINDFAELKSMRTAKHTRNTGVASALLEHVIKQAKAEGINRLNLETGSMNYFQPARNFYEKHGFTYCQPFGEYTHDDNSVFMTLSLL